MGKVHERIDGELQRFIERQHLFFVATAPSEGGHVNVSPKGLDTLRVLGPLQVAYLDLTGSGVETIAHLADDGRITVMFCALSGKPRIVRLYGTGRALAVGSDAYTELAPQFPGLPGARSIVVVDVERVADSCGYSIPRFDYVGERSTLIEWAERKGDDGLESYWAEKNAESIDGLPAL